MRFVVGSLVSATVLFVAGAIGALGSWALPVSGVMLLATAVVAVTVMEDQGIVLAPKRWTEDPDELSLVRDALQRVG